MSHATRDRRTKQSAHLRSRVAGRKKTVPTTREELEGLCPLQPIGSEAEYDRARDLADKLMVLVSPTPLQEEWCDKLCDYMEAYEEVHYPM